MNIREKALKIRLNKQGILGVAAKAPLKNRQDLSILYTPGVAEPCKEIKLNPDLSFEITCRGNMVAVVTDGTRVLGLGDIGPVAGLPVMEGKAVLFKVFADVDAVPGIFRGALDVRARQINEEMKLAAAYAIADLLPEKELREDYVVVDAFDPRVAPAVAAAVAKAAIETGVARVEVDPEEIRARTAARVGR